MTKVHYSIYYDRSIIVCYYTTFSLYIAQTQKTKWLMYDILPVYGENKWGFKSLFEYESIAWADCHYFSWDAG